MSVPQSPAAANLQTLFQYTRWINARMLDAMQAAEAVPARAVKLPSHLLRVQDVWACGKHGPLAVDARRAVRQYA
ncbi:hypothetical protein [Salinibacter grassmerensis]|uniref:hypothetical protein n=1 Tax=Salinibacter grassmerensis TaxID=3040353 RepID=UPI0021E99E7B|nr:hypothetical protein [Salinibacter grassmerensis]